MYTLHDVRAIPGNGGTQPLQTDKGSNKLLQPTYYVLSPLRKPE